MGRVVGLGGCPAPHLGPGSGLNPSFYRKFSGRDVTTPLRPAPWRLGAGLANRFLGTTDFWLLLVSSLLSTRLGLP